METLQENRKDKSIKYVIYRENVIVIDRESDKTADSYEMQYGSGRARTWIETMEASGWAMYGSNYFLMKSVSITYPNIYRWLKTTAVVVKSDIITKRLPNSVCIYAAELYAILLALNELSKHSLSSLNSTANKKREYPITLQILLKYHSLITHSFNIIFCWLPSHIGISGNVKADKAAKSALNELILWISIPYIDHKPIINIYIHDKWQQT